jgi:hypothetical protein
MLSKFSDEQLNAVAQHIDPPFWINKFKKNSQDVELVKQVVAESKL